MKKNYLCIFLFLLISAFIAAPAHSAPKGTSQQTATKVKAQQESAEEASGGSKKSGSSALSQNPYMGAILIDAASGKVLFEDNPDVKSSPASIIKLMNLLIVLEYVKNKAIGLQDTVIISAESAKIGGSQVYLKENEEFTVDELLYALMVQSANDAAVAIAIHVAGTKDAFVDLMNRKAQEIGMTNTNSIPCTVFRREKASRPIFPRPAILQSSARNCLNGMRCATHRSRSGLSGPIQPSPLSCAITIICSAISRAATVSRPAITGLRDFRLQPLPPGKTNGPLLLFSGVKTVSCVTQRQRTCWQRG